MAELERETDCCDSATQDSCCAPADRDDCCTPGSSSCGCSAGDAALSDGVPVLVTVHGLR